VIVALIVFIPRIVELSEKTPTPTHNGEIPQNLISTSQLPDGIKEYASFGEKKLLQNETSGCTSFNTKNDSPDSPRKFFEDWRTDGLKKFENKLYTQASLSFTEAIEKCRNAPETLIYLNNAQVGDGETSTIAVVVPSGATLEDDAVRMLRGFAQAQAEINESSQKLRILVIAVADNSTVAEAVASELEKYPNILAVLGHWSSAVSISAARKYENAGITFVTPISIMDEDNQDLQGLKDYFFRVNTTISAGSKVLVDYAQRNFSNRKFTVFYSGGKYAPPLMEKFREGVGQDRVRIEPFDRSKASATIANEIINDSSSSTDLPVLVFFPSNEDADLVKEIVLAMREVANGKGLKLPGLIGDLANLARPNILRAGGDELQGMILAPSWNYGDQQLPLPFVKNSTALWAGGEVDWTTAMSYNATRAIITAIENSPNPTRKAIQTQLKPGIFKQGVKIPGASGIFQFNQSGSASTDAKLTQICPKGDSRTGYDFVPLPDPNQPACGVD
jgi:branched-chain amino acid transport system substrate-binding protein